MTASPAAPADQLAIWRSRLDELISQDPHAAVAPPDQLAIENLIAAAVAELAGEDAPVPSSALPGRSILAKDLRITTDLVLRALRAHT